MDKESLTYFEAPGRMKEVILFIYLFYSFFFYLSRFTRTKVTN